ncbi:MAG: MotA/TolQ/ExbB proton channel family protein [Pseudomonadota bacterium]
MSELTSNTVSIANDSAGADQAVGSTSAFIDQIANLVGAGGVVVVILIAVSVLALCLIFLKIWQFWAVKIWDHKSVEAALEAFRIGEIRKAHRLSSESQNPVAQVLAFAIRTQFEGHSESLVREELQRLGQKYLQSLRSYLGALETIGTLAPLLGLFGTVLGMIDAFQALSEAGNQVNPSVLSDGIWEALLTTAVGLAVAIPVVAVTNWFEGKSEEVAHQMEDAVTQVFTRNLAKKFQAPSADEAADAVVVPSQ